MWITLIGFVKRALSSPKVMAGFAIAALIAGNVYLKLRLDAVKGKASLLEYRVETVLDANQTNQRTITKLREANEQLKHLMEINVARAGEEAASIEAERSRLLEERSRLQRELRDSLSGSPSCEDLAALDLSALCPDFVERLLRFYERSRQN